MTIQPAVTEHAQEARPLEFMHTHPDCACHPPLWIGKWRDTPVPCQADCDRWIERGHPYARHAGKRVCYDCADMAEKAVKS